MACKCKCKKCTNISPEGYKKFPEWGSMTCRSRREIITGLSTMFPFIPKTLLMYNLHTYKDYLNEAWLVEFSLKYRVLYVYYRCSFISEYFRRVYYLDTEGNLCYVRPPTDINSEERFKFIHMAFEIKQLISCIHFFGEKIRREEIKDARRERILKRSRSSYIRYPNVKIEKYTNLVSSIKTTFDCCLSDVLKEFSNNTENIKYCINIAMNRPLIKSHVCKTLLLRKLLSVKSSLVEPQLIQIISKFM